MIMTVGAEGQNRTGDTSVFSAVLYRLSYLGAEFMVCRGLWGVKLERRGSLMPFGGLIAS